MDKKYYITTPIYYPSDKLHIGHTYCTVSCDTMARYKRMQGYDVMFLTGTDEHGQKLQRAAQERGLGEKEYIDSIVEGIRDLWKRINITNDDFIRTTDSHHEACVQRMFTLMYEKGDIYKSEYEGWYCTPCESFWTESQLAEGNCPDCGRPVERMKEEGYFFRLSKYQDRLIDLIKNNPDFLVPKSRQNEMLNNFLLPGLDDLCVSRTSFDWGVKVPFDEKHIIYVWFDAVINYISALGAFSEDDSKFRRYWPADVHVVGKEIVRFHSLIWPAMLMSLDIPIPKQVFGHGWLLLEGGKMSKSKGNVIDPVVLCDKYGVDAIRYFLVREVPFGADGVFSNEALINRINFDLANDLGNLVSRTTSMGEKYFGGIVEKGGEAGEFDDELVAMIGEVAEKFTEYMDEMHFSNAYAEVWRLIGRANKYIDETMPWILGKDESQKVRLQRVMYNLCDAIRAAAVMIAPAMPETSEKIFEKLGLDPSSLSSMADLGVTGETSVFKVEKGENLFDRIDVEAELAALAAETVTAAGSAKEYAPLESEIEYDVFAKADYRVALVKECEPLPKSDKLLKFTLDLGFEERTVLSGIREWYSPEDLIGKKVIVVANLKPAKIRGEMSYGMILSADKDDGGASVLFAPDDAEPGCKIR